MAKKVEKKPLTKTQIIAGIVDKTKLTKKDVARVLTALSELIGESLS
ncbi:MAG: HU family DNA-binding protein, partial [Thermoguttaceae bacterium]|nr:HU family DNA-binding protein [Thermoguttaceae bacterium]